MKRILAVLLLLALAAPAWGQDFEKGLEAYDRTGALLRLGLERYSIVIGWGRSGCSPISAI